MRGIAAISTGAEYRVYWAFLVPFHWREVQKKLAAKYFRPPGMKSLYNRANCHVKRVETASPPAKNNYIFNTLDIKYPNLIDFEPIKAAKPSSRSQLKYHNHGILAVV
jgi:hypothetical protein